MICEEQRVLAYVSEELDEPARTDFDDHLLGCESCWSAVTRDRSGRALAELLREPAPAGLAERIRLAAQAEGLGLGAPRRHTWVSQTPPAVAGDTRVRPRRRRWALAATLLGAAALIAALLVVTLPGSSPAKKDSSAQLTDAVIGIGKALPMHLGGAGRSSPEPLGSSVDLSVGRVKLHLTYYRVDGGEALVAHSPMPFAMPAGGTPAADGRSWTAEMDGVSIYCACSTGAPAAAIVTPMQPRAAMDLAAYLDMPT